MTSTQEYLVAGMTCEHCVRAVSDEISALDGVTDVRVELAVGALSTVTVTSSAPLSKASIEGAVDEAGYQLAPPS